MRTVVTDGTGTARASPASRSRARPAPRSCARRSSEDPGRSSPAQPPPEEDLTDTDAWFAAFAPLGKPRVAVAVLLVGQGAGGETAAPAAAQVIDAAVR